MHPFKHYARYMLAVIMLVFATLSQASSPEWIVHVTQGRVSYTEAAKISRYVYLYSIQYEVDPQLIFKMMKVESNFNKRARSRANAKGLLQVIEKWHRKKVRGRNLYDIETNIQVGIQIYAEYKERYKTRNRALRAYNGSHRSNKYPKLIAAVKLWEHNQLYPDA